MIQILRFEPFARRVRRSAREIVLAVTLTLAAVVFVLVAVRGMAPETAVVIDPAGKVESKPN